jgi:hypothetical protein
MDLRELTMQIYSDIHIEIWNKLPVIPVMAKYLFLAGDICPLNHPLFYKFFDYCSSKWEKIFYTPGNNEFYSGKKNYDELNFEYDLKIKEKYKNIYYLNDNVVSLNEHVDIYGSIFWTIPTFTSTYTAKIYIKDYNHIKYFNKKLKHNVSLDIHYITEIAKTSYSKLKKHLETTNKITIVMTHFPPLREGTSNPIYNYKPDNIKNYFSWNDETINNLNLNNVPLWISGHTHWAYNIYKNNCIFLANQIGYKDEADIIGFNEYGLHTLLY